MADIYSDPNGPGDTTSRAGGSGKLDPAAGATAPQGSLPLDGSNAEALPVKISNNGLAFNSPLRNAVGQREAAADHQPPVSADALVPFGGASARPKGTIVSNLSADTEENISEEEVVIGGHNQVNDLDDEWAFPGPAEHDRKPQDLSAPGQISKERSNAEVASMVGGGMGGSLLGGIVGAAIGFAIFSWTGPGALGGAVLGAGIGATLFGGGAAAALSHNISHDVYGGVPQGHALDMHLKALAREGVTNPRCRYQREEQAALKHIPDRTMRLLLRLPTHQIIPPRPPILAPERAQIQKAVVHVLLKTKGDLAKAVAAKEALINIARVGSKQDVEMAVNAVLRGDQAEAPVAVIGRYNPHSHSDTLERVADTVMAPFRKTKGHRPPPPRALHDRLRALTSSLTERYPDANADTLAGLSKTHCREALTHFGGAVAFDILHQPRAQVEDFIDQAATPQEAAQLKAVYAGLRAACEQGIGPVGIALAKMPSGLSDAMRRGDPQGIERAIAALSPIELADVHGALNETSWSDGQFVFDRVSPVAMRVLKKRVGDRVKREAGRSLLPASAGLPKASDLAAALPGVKRSKARTALAAQLGRYEDKLAELAELQPRRILKREQRDHLRSLQSILFDVISATDELSARAPETRELSSLRRRLNRERRYVENALVYQTWPNVRDNRTEWPCVDAILRDHALVTDFTDTNVIPGPVVEDQNAGQNAQVVKIAYDIDGHRHDGFFKPARHQDKSVASKYAERCGINLDNPKYSQRSVVSYRTTEMFRGHGMLHEDKNPMMMNAYAMHNGFAGIFSATATGEPLTQKVVSRLAEVESSALDEEPDVVLSAQGYNYFKGSDGVWRKAVERPNPELTAALSTDIDFQKQLCDQQWSDVALQQADRNLTNVRVEQQKDGTYRLQVFDEDLSLGPVLYRGIKYPPKIRQEYAEGLRDITREEWQAARGTDLSDVDEANWSAFQQIQEHVKKLLKDNDPKVVIPKGTWPDNLHQDPQYVKNSYLGRFVVLP